MSDIVMDPPMSSEHSATPEPVSPAHISKVLQHAAASETIMICWRIQEAFLHYPENPTPLQTRQFAHGFGRELWMALLALGFSDIFGRLGSGDKPEFQYYAHTHTLNPLLCRFVVQGMRIRVFPQPLTPEEISQFRVFMAAERKLVSDLAVGPMASAGAKLGPAWWNWTQDDGVKKPSWWENPDDFVPRPMAIHISDLEDMKL